MDGKSLVLLGLGVSALYMFVCISTHKDQMYAELNPSPAATVTSETTEVVKEEVIPLVQTEVKTIDSSFLFNNAKPYTFKVLLGEEHKEDALIQQIIKWCESQTCTNELQFVKNAKGIPWTAPTLALSNYIMEKNIKNGSITIEENLITVTGDLEDTKSDEAMKQLLEGFDSSYQIQNNTKIVESMISNELNESTTSSSPELEITEESITESEMLSETETVTDIETVSETETVSGTETIADITNPVAVSEEDKLKEAQSKINELLRNAVINFKLNSSTILPSSKKVLDEIIQLVNKLNIQVDLEITGHTDASGNANYNKVLSQRRAESVKSYLLKNNIKVKQLTSTGHGEEKLIFAPNDKQNRRVEIYLTKGK